MASIFGIHSTDSHSTDSCKCTGNDCMDSLNHDLGQDQGQDYQKRVGDYMEQSPKISPPTN